MKANFKTPVICVEKGTSLAKAKEIMIEKRIHHLPVVDANNEIISILSDRDFSGTDEVSNWPVDYFATSPVHAVTGATPLREVALIMLNKKISSVLLTDEDRSILGIITSNDLLFHLSELLKNTDESSAGSTAPKKWSELDILSTAGEFFRRLSEIGI